MVLEGRALAHHGDFAGIAGGIIGRLEDERQLTKSRMAHDAGQGIKPNLALAEAGVTVFVAATPILAVIETDGARARKSYGAINVCASLIEIPSDIVAGVPDVAGIETDTEQLRVFYAVDDGTKLFKAPSYFRTLAGHGLKQHGGLLRWMQDLVELLGNQLDASFHALLDMTAWMEVVKVAWQLVEAL